VGIRGDSIACRFRDSVQRRKSSFTIVLTVIRSSSSVIFLFLRNLSETIIPESSRCRVESIVGTFAAMYLLDYSLDNLSLMALTLAVGFVRRRRAIVMLENHRPAPRRCGKSADGGRAGWIEGSRVHDSLDDAVARRGVHPVLFMGGIVGRLLHEFAVTIGVRSWSPASSRSRSRRCWAARWPAARYPPEARSDDTWPWSRFSSGAGGPTGCTLKLTIRYRAVTMALSALLLARHHVFFQVIPKGFIPSVRHGQISGQVEMCSQGLGYESRSHTSPRSPRRFAERSERAVDHVEPRHRTAGGANGR
jgi:HAE1 family hydrophobic/amphiphilic exporter-1